MVASCRRCGKPLGFDHGEDHAQLKKGLIDIAEISFAESRAV